jgi:hypothetical protein
MWCRTALNALLVHESSCARGLDVFFAFRENWHLSQIAAAAPMQRGAGFSGKRLFQPLPARQPAASPQRSLAFGNRCRQAGVRPSMGSVGDAGETEMAVVEFILELRFANG